jgi:hypothetical protein
MVNRSKLAFVATFLLLLLVPALGYGQPPDDRMWGRHDGPGYLPFTASFEGAAHWGFPGDSPSDCEVATTLTEAQGQASYMGRATLSSSHCPAMTGYTADGRLTIKAANGDLLFGRYDYDPSDSSLVFPIEWVGGTGRFARASGTALMKAGIEPKFTPGCVVDSANPVPCFDYSVPWPWWATLKGFISDPEERGWQHGAGGDTAFHSDVVWTKVEGSRTALCTRPAPAGIVYLMRNTITGTTTTSPLGAAEFLGHTCVYGTGTTPAGWFMDVQWTAPNGEVLLATSDFQYWTGTPGQSIAVDNVTFVNGGTGRFKYAHGEATSRVDAKGRTATYEGALEYGKKPDHCNKER